MLKTKTSSDEQQYSSRSVSRIIQTEDNSIRVKVIAGEALGAHGIIETRTPILYLHFTLQPGAKVTQPIPKQYNAFAYVINGEGLFGMEDNIKQNMVANTGQMVVFDKNGEEVTMRAATADDDDD